MKKLVMFLSIFMLAGVLYAQEADFHYVYPCKQIINGSDYEIYDILGRQMDAQTCSEGEYVTLDGKIIFFDSKAVEFTCLLNPDGTDKACVEVKYDNIDCKARSGGVLDCLEKTSGLTVPVSGLLRDIAVSKGVKEVIVLYKLEPAKDGGYKLVEQVNWFKRYATPYNILVALMCAACLVLIIIAVRKRRKNSFIS